MSNHAHLRPHNAVRAGADRARIRGAIPDAYAGKRPTWRRPARATGPNVRQLAKLAEQLERRL